MRGRAHYRRTKSRKNLILLTLLFWAVSGITTLALVNQSAEISGQVTEETIARKYLDNVFQTVSRGTPSRTGKPEGFEEDQGQKEEAVNTDAAASQTVSASVKGMIGLSFPIAAASADDHVPVNEAMYDEQEVPLKAQTDKPDVTGALLQGEEETGYSESENGGDEQVAIVDTETSKEPLVLILHTHATESYQPVSEGNFHSTNEYGTVREVGEVLANQLTAKGIPVIHDKTLNDHPSYNQSYSRSLQTMNNYLDAYPSIQIVVDLHRDAASYTGNVGKMATIDGNSVAKYSLVVGNGNANVKQLKTFATRINEIAESLYPGYGGTIINKDYRFNQYVKDQYILLEVGNNENTIDQAKLSAKYFADVLEAYIIENQLLQ